MQKKWLLEFEIQEVLKIAKSRAPRKNKNQEKEKPTDSTVLDRLPDDSELGSIRRFNLLMPLASRSVKTLDKIISRAETEEAYDSGVGNFGGHIARKLKTPGPLNGKHVFEMPKGTRY